MTIQSVFSGAGGGQVYLYEAYSGGTYVDTMGVGSDFEQPNSGNRPAANTTAAPSGATMLSFDGNDLVGDFGTGGIVDDADMPAWGGIFVEHFILYFPSSPNNSTEERLIDQGGGSWGRNQFGAGILYRAEALSDSAMSATTRYCVTIEHNASTTVSTMTIEGTAQSDTGGNWDGMRDDFLGYKLIGAQGDLSKGFTGCFGCYGLGHATTWGSTERAALFDAMDEWWTGGGGGGTVYTMPASSLAFGFSGPPANLLRARRLTADARAYGFSGPPANLLRAERLTADARAFGFSGPAAGLYKGQRLTADARAFGFSGPAANLLRAERLTADARSYGFSGPGANLLRAERLVADARAYGVSGPGASLLRGLNLPATSSAFGFSGIDSGLVVRRMTASAQAIGFTGMSAELDAQRKITATAASIAFAGQDVAFTQRDLVAASAEIAFTPRAADLLRAAKLTATTASIAFAGQDVIFYAGVRLAAESAALTFTGRTTSFTASRRLPAVVGSLSFAGQNVGLYRGLRLSATSASLAFSGQSVTLARGYGFAGEASAITFTGRAATFSRAARLIASTSALTFVGVDTALLYSASFHTLQATAEAIPFVGYDVTLGHFRPHILRIAWSQKPAARIVFTQKPAGRIAFEQRPAALIVWRRTMSTPLNVNDTNRIDFTFYDTDNDEEPADPTTLSAVVVSPSGVRTTYTYGVDSEWEKRATGVYRLSILCSEAKTWSWTVTAAGNVKGVESSSFTVNRNA